MAATMTHIAKEAGVSVALVSRLLRNDPTLRITEARRRQILDIHKRVGTVKTRSRRRRLSHTIVVPVSSDFSPQYIHANVLEIEPYRSFNSHLRKHGFHLYFDFIPEAEIVQRIGSLVGEPASCDGLLLLSGLCCQEIADDLGKARFPHVSNDFHAERYQINTVHAHLTQGTARVIEHLYALGHRRIGYLGARAGFRHAMTVAALAAMRLPLDESLHCWLEVPPLNSSQVQRWDFARDALRQWIDSGRLNRSDAPTALICTNDYAALGAADALRERGLRPGIDLSLAGYDNIEVRGPYPAEKPILTTIDNPLDQIGRRMGELLLNQILHNQHQIVHERLPAPVIERESTGPAPGMDAGGLDSINTSTGAGS